MDGGSATATVTAVVRWWRSDGGSGDAMTTVMTTTTTVSGVGWRVAGGRPVAATKGGGQRRQGLNSVVVFLLNSALESHAVLSVDFASFVVHRL